MRWLRNCQTKYVSETLRDLRFALRQLVDQPRFSIILLLTLALGIGAGLAVFSMANSALLRPLPGIAAADRIVSFGRVQANDSFDNMSYPDYLDYRDRNRTLSGIAAHCGASMAFRRGPNATAERVLGDVVTGNYFDVLGVKPAGGRLIGPGDDRSDAAPVAVASYGFWRRSLNSDPGVIGASVTLNGHPFTIVGVAAREFSGTLIGQPFDLWTPLSTVRQSIPRLSQTILDSRNAGWLNIFGRLKPGVDRRRAEVEMKTIAGQLAAAYPATNQDRTVALIPGVGLFPDDRAELDRLLGVLSAAVGLLLLVACVNAAGLFLVRGWRRQREIALRLALGAGRPRILRQLLTEAMLIALIAGALGLLLSAWAAKLMAAVPPGSVLHNLDVSVDARVMIFAALASAIVGILFALAPAIRSLPLDVIEALKDGGRAGFRRSTLQRGLVIVQVTSSFLLLSAAGLLTRDLYHIVTANPGYETHSLAMGSVDLITQGYSSDRGIALYRQLMDRLPQLPGVDSAALAGSVPPVEWPGRVSIFYPGQEPPPDLFRAREMELGMRVDINRISPDYFRTLGIGLVSGRDFTRHDDDATPAVAIVNRSLASELWPGENAIGKRISAPGPEDRLRPLEVIGVAADTRSRALTTAAVPLLYLPLLQNYDGRTFLVMRTKSDPGLAVLGITETLQSIDKDLALYGARTMTEHVARSLWQQRMAAAWVAAFGVMALALAAIGLYGLMAQSTTRRTREIGIRIALGAGRGEVMGLVMREGLTLAGAGFAVAVPLSMGLTGVLRKLIPGLTGGDVSSFLLAALLLAVVMAAACWIPAHRAARVDPIEALRSE
jgi:macrolide transport system ATP-binding/permease protein